MTMVQRFLIGHVLVATAAFAIAYARVGVLFASLGIIAVGAMWLAAQQREPARASGALSGLLMNGLIISGAVAFLVGGPGWLLLLGTVAALGAWDLDHFYQRLRTAEKVELSSGLGRDHLRRLGLVEGLGFLVGLVGLTTQVQFSFWWEALLALLAVFGLTRLVRYVRREMD